MSKHPERVSIHTIFIITTNIADPSSCVLKVYAVDKTVI